MVKNSSNKQNKSGSRHVSFSDPEIIGPTQPKRQQNESDEGSTSEDSNESYDFLTTGPQQQACPKSHDRHVSSSDSEESTPPRTVERNQRKDTKGAKKGKNRKNTSPGKLQKEIWRLQTSTNMLIPKLPFSRLVKEIIQQSGIQYRIQRQGLEALQEASEMAMIHLFEDAFLLTAHRDRVTLNKKDIDCFMSLQSRDHPFFA